MSNRQKEKTANSLLLPSYLRQLQAQARAARQGTDEPHKQSLETNIYTDDSPSIPSIVSVQASPNTTVDVPLERDDWWYKGTDDLFLNRSGEHRMSP